MNISFDCQLCLLTMLTIWKFKTLLDLILTMCDHRMTMSVQVLLSAPR